MSTLITHMSTKRGEGDDGETSVNANTSPSSLEAADIIDNSNNNNNNNNLNTPVKQQHQQQQLQNNLLSPTLMSNGVPNIDLVKTSLVKNRVEIDFSAKAIKEGLFSMWTSCADNKVNYASKDLTIKIDPPQLVFGDSTSTSITSSTIVNGAGILNNASSSSSSGQGLTMLMKNSASANQTTTGTSIKEEDAVAAFEYIHHCIFFGLSSMKKDVIQQMDNYFIHIIKDNPSNVKSILTCLFDIFTYYRSISKAEEANDAKRFSALSLALDRFIEETLSNGLRDASEFSLSHLQKQFNAHLTEQLKKMGNQDSSLFNDAIQKFNYILSQSVEMVESIEKSKIISKAMKLDTYHEKIARQKSKSLSNKEFFLFHLKYRKMNIDSRPFYGRANFSSDKSFLQWKKVEENNLQKLSQQLQPKEEYLKSVWGIKYKEKDTIGVIAIKVVQARDLINKEGSIVKPEPHIEIEFENEKKRTRKVNGLNPVWKEHFNFQITKQNQNLEIEFSVWDGQGTESSKVFLGKCKFTIRELMNYVKREVSWVPLQKRSSRSKVSGDLKLQFHFLDYPDPKSPYPNHFHYYRILLEKLLSIDIQQQQQQQGSDIGSGSPNSSSPNNLSGANRVLPFRRKAIDITKPISLLSNQSTQILKDYAERYGLLEHTTKLILVEYLIKLIIDDMALEYIPEVRGILKYILEIKFSDFCGLTIIEEKILKELVEKLSVACNTWISHFHTVFPLNTPTGSLRMLIDIFYLLRSSELCQLTPLPHIIKEMYEKRFNQAIIMAQTMTKGTQLGRASTIIRVCDILLANLDIDVKYFARDFPTSEVNILTVSIQVYNDLLEKEIDKLTEHGANNLQELTEFLELYFKLKETMIKFKDIDQKLALLPIPILFKQCVLQWTLHSADQLQQLIDKLCQNEEWTPVSDDTLHSKSVGEVFLGCYHALDVIKSLRWEDFQKFHKDGEHSLFEIFTNFTVVISESIIYYTTVIRDLSLKALDEAADDIFLLSDSYSQDLVQTIQTVSLRFNNIQACLGHTEDLISVLLRIMASYRLSPSIVNEMSRHTYKAINDNVRTLVDRIYNRLSPVIIGEIYNIVGIDLDKSKNFVVGFFKQIEKNIDQLSNTNNQMPVSVQLTPLLQYIASKLQLFSQHLYYPLTKQLLKRLWAGIINILDDMIFPKNKNLELSSYQLDMIDGMVKCFGEFFYIDGEGLTQKAIDKQSERFIIIIMAYREAINSGVRNFDPLGLKNALKNINLANLRPDLGALKKLNINLKGIPKQLDIFSLIKNTIERKQKERKEREDGTQSRKSFNIPKLKLPFKIVLNK
ncbi:hypothetical protein DFA_02714 [Cavenderia fasciculata]|uniref:C2 domain-containing protein n=1 Tax=Cavenderia fasciculata TaxID=261658 RepID=F4PHY4_CACFS|nr:uncharacterized protein DFA_02714 [Cavenderia fasciculata]EGG24471.1 hypothetical protein DFA_02714 [Cavenderia fasciculata]|eukprot:XP_004362322.1 hypothetical protein DFA_02714 [Cavenderia fasciculata]